MKTITASQFCEIFNHFAYALVVTNVGEYNKEYLGSISSIENDDRFYFYFRGFSEYPICVPRETQIEINEIGEAILKEDKLVLRVAFLKREKL